MSVARVLKFASSACCDSSACCSLMNVGLRSNSGISSWRKMLEPKQKATNCEAECERNRSYRIEKQGHLGCSILKQNARKSRRLKSASLFDIHSLGRDGRMPDMLNARRLGTGYQEDQGPLPQWRTILQTMSTKSRASLQQLTQKSTLGLSVRPNATPGALYDQSLMHLSNSK